MFFLLLSQAQPQPAAGEFLTSMFWPIALTIVIFYFFLIRPENKKRKELQDQVSQLKKHDRVLTSGGIVGTVWAVKENEIVLQVDDNAKTRIHFVKSAIVSRLNTRSDKDPVDAEVVSTTTEADKEKKG